MAWEPRLDVLLDEGYTEIWVVSRLDTVTNTRDWKTVSIAKSTLSRITTY